MIKHYWWKILGVAIIALVIVLGFLVPLKPGILLVEPFAIETGKPQEIRIKGYNTFFTKAADMGVWLKIDELHAWKLEQIEVLSDTEMRAQVVLPARLPVRANLADVALVVNSDVDGAFVRPFAMAIRQTEGAQDAEDSALLWQENPIKGLYTLDAFRYPFRNILNETIRNTYFHIPMWFGMILIFLLSAFYAVKYLRKPSYDLDERVSALIGVGLLYGVLGIATGAIWARFTWGDYWSGDIKQNMSLICLLIYSAYFMLRSSMNDPERKGRVSAAYSLFAFVAMIPLLFIIPRMQDSLHPGSGGNPALGGEDLDNTMRMIFYPAIIGWTLIGLWMANLQYRWRRIQRIQTEIEMNR